MPIRYRDFLRYAVFGIAVALIVGFVISPFAGSIIEQWSRADVESRSKLVFTAIQPFLDSAIEDKAWARLGGLFKRVASDKRILAVGLCDASGSLIAPSPEMPASFSCEKIAKSDSESFADITSGGHRLLAAAFPVVTAKSRSYLVILTDLSFATARSNQALAYILAALAGVVAVLMAGAVVFALLMLRDWMN